MVRKGSSWRGMVVASAVLCVAFGGCIGEPQMLDNQRAGPSAISADSASATVSFNGTPDALAPGQTWSRWMNVISGEAGSWVVIYRDLPPPDGEGKPFRYHLRVEVSTAGGREGPSVLYSLPPQIVTNSSSGLRATIDDARFLIDRAGGPLVHRQDYVREWQFLSGGGVVGLIAVFGANHPWAANITVDVGGEGPDSGPSFRSVGDGVFASPLGTRLLGVHSAADSYAVGMAIDGPGLTQIQFESASHADYNVGFKSCRMSLNENQRMDCGMSSIDIFGVHPNRAGTASVELEYVFPLATEYEPTIVHLRGGPEMMPERMLPLEIMLWKKFLPQENGPPG